MIDLPAPPPLVIRHHFLAAAMGRVLLAQQRLDVDDPVEGLTLLLNLGKAALRYIHGGGLVVWNPLVENFAPYPLLNRPWTRELNSDADLTSVTVDMTILCPIANEIYTICDKLYLRDLNEGLEASLVTGIDLACCIDDDGDVVVLNPATNKIVPLALRSDVVMPPSCTAFVAQLMPR